MLYSRHEVFLKANVLIFFIYLDNTASFVQVASEVMEGKVTLHGCLHYKNNDYLHRMYSKLLIRFIWLVWFKLIALTLNHTCLTGWKAKNYDLRELKWWHLFIFHKRSQIVLYHEMCISLSITQVTITACTQGTYSFPVSAVISEQAVDLILHEEGKTNIQ